MALLSEVHALALRESVAAPRREVFAGLPALSLEALEHQSVATHVAFESVILAVWARHGEDAAILLGFAVGPTLGGLSCHSG